MKIHDVEQNSTEWFALRAGKPTASEFKRIVSGTGKASTQATGYAHELAAEAFAGGEIDRWQGNEYTERGHELEADAAAMYAFQNDVEPEVVGFCTDDAEKWGASPDRLIDGDGILEIKCLSAKNHVAALMHFKKTGKPKADYISQLQGQMFVCGRGWCDIFFYHPTLPSFQVRVEMDDAFQQKLLVGLVDVLKTRNDAIKAMEEMA
jgi:putative phage-type endonuclease